MLMKRDSLLQRVRHRRRNHDGKTARAKARRIVLLTHVLGLIMKAIGYFFSGSAVLMNESIHSLIDCINQGLLAIGEKRAQRGRSELHQFGEGRATYFLVL